MKVCGSKGTGFACCGLGSLGLVLLRIFGGRATRLFQYLSRTDRVHSRRNTMTSAALHAKVDAKPLTLNCGIRHQDGLFQVGRCMLS